MLKNLDNLLNLLASKDLAYTEFVHKALNIAELAEIFDVGDIDLWQILGLDIVKYAGKVELKTRLRPICDQEFCIVDVETTGGVKSGQIIEIGAVKILSGDIVGKFHSLIYAPEVPENITELTGISSDDLTNAPKIKSVMERFRHFLGSAVFVAHNVNFDYGFVSKSMSDCGFGILLNRKLCTIELARRTIAFERYGLSALKELFNITNTHHRAFSDAVAASEIFKISLSRLPQNVKTTEELIKFSKTAPNLRTKPILNEG
ncbi:DNA polymerase III subunit epsilon [Campylobacter mucosalis]|nr:3'-5' exonuclease [Campylobacter mucosalis]KEA46317.1 DNA polymerase III subunit epsilon [Campylobacter mucosalis]